MEIHTQVEMRLKIKPEVRDLSYSIFKMAIKL